MTKKGLKKLVRDISGAATDWRDETSRFTVAIFST